MLIAIKMLQFIHIFRYRKFSEKEFLTDAVDWRISNEALIISKIWQKVPDQT